MRQIALCLLNALIWSCSAPALAAETGSDTQPALDDNYRLVLTDSGQEGQATEVSVVFASDKFEVSTYDPTLKFAGTVKSKDEKTMLVRYSLMVESVMVTGEFTSEKSEKPFQTIQRVESGTQSSVKLRLGEPIEILRIGSRTFRLVISEVP